MIKRPDNRLAEVMADKDIAARDLAVELDVTEHTIRRFQNPQAAIPSKYLPTLVDLLGVTADHLLGLDREPSTTRAAA